MNKQVIAKVVAAAVFVVIAVKLDFLGALFALVFLGAIPGTDFSIPPAIMMIAYPLAIIVVLIWLARQPLYIGSQEKQEKTARAVARKRVAKKTTKATAKRKTARA